MAFSSGLSLAAAPGISWSEYSFLVLMIFMYPPTAIFTSAAVIDSSFSPMEARYPVSAGLKSPGGSNRGIMVPLAGSFPTDFHRLK